MVAGIDIPLANRDEAAVLTDGLEPEPRGRAVARIRPAGGGQGRRARRRGSCGRDRPTVHRRAPHRPGLDGRRRCASRAHVPGARVADAAPLSRLPRTPPAAAAPARLTATASGRSQHRFRRPPASAACGPAARIRPPAGRRLRRIAVLHPPQVPQAELVPFRVEERHPPADLVRSARPRRWRQRSPAHVAFARTIDCRCSGDRAVGGRHVDVQVHPVLRGLPFRHGQEQQPRRDARSDRRWPLSSSSPDAGHTRCSAHSPARTRSPAAGTAARSRATCAQNRACRRGSAQSNVTWNGWWMTVSADMS